MDTITLALGAALGVAGILLVYWIAASRPAWKAAAAAWFRSEKSALGLARVDHVEKAAKVMAADTVTPHLARLARDDHCVRRLDFAAFDGHLFDSDHVFQ